MKRAILILTAGLAAVLPARSATLSDNVTLNLSGLPTLGSGNYTLEFNFVDGDGVTNNTVTITNFQITDTLIPSLSLSGNASGTLATTLVLTDAQALGFSDANQGFNHTAGSGSLSFTFSYTTAFAGGTPDEFSFLILDNNLNTIVTNPASNGGLIQLDINSGSATPQVFAADPSFGSIQPIVTPTGPLAAPEPGTFGLLIAGLIVIASGTAMRLRRRRT
jgi:hypothetical protein